MVIFSQKSKKTRKENYRRRYTRRSSHNAPQGCPCFDVLCSKQNWNVNENVRITSDAVKSASVSWCRVVCVVARAKTERRWSSHLRKNLNSNNYLSILFFRDPNEEDPRSNRDRDDNNGLMTTCRLTDRTWPNRHQTSFQGFEIKKENFVHT